MTTDPNASDVDAVLAEHRQMCCLLASAVDAMKVADRLYNMGPNHTLMAKCREIEKWLDARQSDRDDSITPAKTLAEEIAGEIERLKMLALAAGAPDRTFVKHAIRHAQESLELGLRYEQLREQKKGGGDGAETGA